MNQFCCSTCNNPLRIKNGNFMFTYNIECCKNHFRENVELEDVLSFLSTKTQKPNICENHKKNNLIHCFDCNIDICCFCYKEFHSFHKMEYLKILNEEEIYEISLKKEYEIDKNIETFISELIHFKNELNLYIDKLKVDLQNFCKFRCVLVNNISSGNSPYINIENVKNLFKNYDFLKDIMEKFFSCDTFIQRYNSLKNIFEIMIKKGKYIESQNIKYILEEKIIPIDEKYFMKIDKNKLNILEKSLELKKYKFNNIFEKLFSFNINKIELKESKNIKKKLSLYILSYSEYIPQISPKILLYEITIENLCDFNIKEISKFDKHVNLFVLSENKNIIDDGDKIMIYDDSFKTPKLISNEISHFQDFLKIDLNTFICSSVGYKYYGIVLVNIIGNKIIINKISSCGDTPIYFSEKEKILFTACRSFLYLINFNSSRPEVIQKVKLKDSYYDSYDSNNNIVNYTKLIRCITSFNDESIYITVIDHNGTRIFLVQYKIIEGELMEISRIRIN